MPPAAREKESVMPAAPSHALLALHALIDELDIMRTHPIARIGEPAAEASTRVANARREAMARLAAADRLDLFDAATQALATACARREIPQCARAAAYSALVGLIANDLLPPGTFHILFDDWEAALDRHGDSPVILRGEEVLFHIE
jgi:hypothetical protein